jgi:hypothetical protein
LLTYVLLTLASILTVVAVTFFLSISGFSQHVFKTFIVEHPTAVCETSMIVSTLAASNILGKYAFGQRRMPAIFAPSSGCTPII